MAKAFCDEEKKRQTHKDDESDDDKGKERPKDARPAFQEANKTRTYHKISFPLSRKI